jgi:predicted kinase
MRSAVELRVLIGIQCSGKSTYALDFVSKNPNWIRVSRDDIRMYMFGREHDPSIENMVSTIQDNLIRDFLRKGHNVIVDNCNVKESYRNDLYKIAKSVGNVLYKEMVFDTSLEVCVERNSKRDRKVPEDVITKFAKLGRDILWGNKKPKTEFIQDIEVNESLYSDVDYWLKANSLAHRHAIIVDLDGTFAFMNGRNPYDASTCDQDLVSIPVLQLINGFYELGYEILFVSGREDKFKEPTIKFLEKALDLCGSYYKWFDKRNLYMRKSGDMRADTIVKKEIYLNDIQDKYSVLAVVDDRPQVVRMWRRELNLFVFQVNDVEF